MSIFKTPRSGYGFIYILSNESMVGILKVGLTTNSVHQRVTELNTTGVPTKFKSERIFEIEERFLRRVEGEVHDLLKREGLHHGKEFFRVDLGRCARCVEDVIHRVTGSVAPELIGEAQVRQERERKRAQWELDEKKRIRRILEDRNDEIRSKRMEWIEEERRRSALSIAVEPKSLFSKFTDGLALIIGIPLMLFVGWAIVLLLADVFGWILFILLCLVGVAWFYIRSREDEKKQQRNLQSEAERLFPLVKEEDIGMRESPSFDTTERHTGSTRPEKRAATTNSTPKQANSPKRVLYRYFRTKNGVGDKRSGIFHIFGVLQRSTFPVSGYWCTDFGFVSDEEIETPVLLGGKATSSCPECGLKCRGELVPVAEITCPSCRTIWKQQFDA